MMFMLIAILVLIVAACFLLFGYTGFLEDFGYSVKLAKFKFIGYGLIGVGVVLILIYFNTAQGARDLKSFTSNTTGGLERKVEVYDQTGKLIKTYEGKFDVQDTDYGNKVLFDLNGKRTIIYNATVIVQEK